MIYDEVSVNNEEQKMFIKLTGARVPSSVFVKVDNIILIDSKTLDDNEAATAVFVEGRERCFIVQETPEQIMEMIEKC
jgi:hypothetical protein